jgi:hypothetical protein
MNLTEGKALLAAVQDCVVAQQVRKDLEQRRACPQCEFLRSAQAAEGGAKRKKNSSDLAARSESVVRECL